ncbi:50S ribosomal protein L18, partial [Acinetobacter baumannii]
RSRLRRKKRISFKVKGTAERPRLAIFRSNAAFYAQIIDDTSGKTLMAIATNGKEQKGKVKNTIEGITSLGKSLAQQAGGKNITQVVFDRA